MGVMGGGGVEWQVCCSSNFLFAFAMSAPVFFLYSIDLYLFITIPTNFCFPYIRPFFFLRIITLPFNSSLSPIKNLKLFVQIISLLLLIIISSM